MLHTEWQNYYTTSIRFIVENLNATQLCLGFKQFCQSLTHQMIQSVSWPVSPTVVQCVSSDVCHMVATRSNISSFPTSMFRQTDSRTDRHLFQFFLYSIFKHSHIIFTQLYLDGGLLVVFVYALPLDRDILNLSYLL